MEHAISDRCYLSKETTQALKRLLYKTKTVPEIQINGKIYMERRDYRKLRENEAAADAYAAGQIQPVYGVVQLLNLFEEKTERVRITSRSYSIVEDLYLKLKEAVPVDSDMIVADRNEIEITPDDAFAMRYL